MRRDPELEERISTLLLKGQEMVDEGYPESVAVFKEAHRLAAAAEDFLYAARARLALARAYGRLHGNLELFEELARNAVAEGSAAGRAGRQVMLGAKLSLGEAILEQIKAGSARPSRLKEARVMLRYAAAAEDADPLERAAARYGLGEVEVLAGNHEAAAEEFLAAGDLYESRESWDAAGGARANAGREYLTAGRTADAVSASTAASQALSHLPRPKMLTVVLIDQVLRAAASA
jgi:hypothetical protein